MKKIGFIDYFLDEWHANNYPAWIRGTRRDVDIGYAWAEIDQPNGLNTSDWCTKHQVRSLSSVEELVEKSDYLIVLSPDHPEHHERLSRLALMSGKPVYVDKTFSPNLESGQRMFELAEKHGTPLFSSSALRFAEELSGERLDPGTIEYMATTGPGEYKNYSVHQYEMIVSKMGPGAKRIKSLSTTHSTLLMIEYADGRQASFSQMKHVPFQVNLQLKDGEGIWIADYSNMFPRLIDSILDFFETGNAPVPKEETLEIMALIEAGEKALQNRDTWINVG